MSTGTDTIEVRITDVSAAADDTRVFWLARTDGAALPAYAPGSHIDVHLLGCQKVRVQSADILHRDQALNDKRKLRFRQRIAGLEPAHQLRIGR